MKKILLPFAFQLLIFFIFDSVVLADHTTAYQGRKLYSGYCKLCHGTLGKGDGLLAHKLKSDPIDLTDKSRLERTSDADLMDIIKTDCNYLLPAEKDKALSEHQLGQLVAYIRFTQQNNLLADPQTGETIYQQNCASCHGKEGKSDGIIKGIVPLNQVDHSNPSKMDALSNEQLIDIVTTGKGKLMPGWKDRLSQADIEAVVSYLRFLSH